MQTVGPLMIEHRLIEKMIVLLKKELKHAEKKCEAHCDFISSAVDFFKTYADQCHHGKEEDILFKNLQKKNLSSEHKKILDRLLHEHVLSRHLIKSLNSANKRYLKNKDEKDLNKIQKILTELVELYPQHIDMEDNHFFLPAMKYFTKEENQDMLAAGYEYDQTLIHLKYQDIIAELEKNLPK